MHLPLALPPLTISVAARQSETKSPVAYVSPIRQPAKQRSQPCSSGNSFAGFVCHARKAPVLSSSPGAGLATSPQNTVTHTQRQGATSSHFSCKLNAQLAFQAVVTCMVPPPSIAHKNNLQVCQRHSQHELADTPCRFNWNANGSEACISEMSRSGTWSAVAILI